MVERTVPDSVLLFEMGHRQAGWASWLGKLALVTSLARCMVASSDTDMISISHLISADRCVVRQRLPH